MDEIAWDPKYLLNLAHFEIGGKDFGPLTFHKLPLKLPFHIDGILGMEFFAENLVFLDFVHGHAYFLSSKIKKV